MVLRIVKSLLFNKNINKLDNSSIVYAKKLIKKIVENPEIGKPMRYERKGTRELYIKPFRISYEYHSHDDKLEFLSIYHKKKQ